ncbi:ELMO domain-containing protein 2 [Phlebotomus papatasi]|uniref:ELMO domain-containing protein 2 n=1 Tax=Phlebotomus papatasi TaxID=29031 RepID=UPI00248364A8|nr:ELMO domain-containing protein 2 [Phlebotomus papatasi]
MYFKIFTNVITLVYFYVRPLVKWFLHKFTKLCELQRICYGEPTGAPRAKSVERSLELSRNKQIVDMVKILNGIVEKELTDEDFFADVTDRALETVLRVKKIKPRIHPDFPAAFEMCVEQIWGYRRLYHEVERLRMTPYDCDNLQHEIKLNELWKLLMPDVELEARVTKQWQDIGFQGDDPKTDFRGMGILSLENLLFFAREYHGAAQHVLSHSHHPKHGYTFAIVGINLTSMAYKLLKSGAAKTHIYNAVYSTPSINTFHHLYCYLFYEFDRYWMECKPKNIMEFSYIQEKFEANILRDLSNNSTIFRINLSIDNI